MEITAEALLRTYTNAALQVMARKWEVGSQSKNKSGLIKQLSRSLYDPERIERALADLAPRERQALDHVILAGGSLRTQTLRTALEREGLVERGSRRYGFAYGLQEQGSAQARDSAKFADIVARLGALGLVFSAEPVGKSLHDFTAPGRLLVIPDEILRHLPPVTVETVTTEPPPVVEEANPAPLLRDLYTLLSFASREPVQLTMRGQIVKRSLSRLDQMLLVSEMAPSVRSEDDLGRIPFLRALAEDLRLLSASVGTLAANPGIEEFLGKPAGARLKQLYDAYRNTGRWNELYRIPNLSISGKGASLRDAPSQVVAARRRVLAEIAALPSERWIPISHLVDRIRRLAYEFLLSRRLDDDHFGYYYGYGQVNPYSGPNELGVTFPQLFDESGWDQVEAGMIRVIVVEALHWLGVVDLGLSDGQAFAFRVTPDGARLLRGEEVPSSAAAPQVVVQPNFQIFAFPPTGEDVLFTLDRIAERVRAEQAIEYELTRDSIYRAQQSGLEVERIIAFLEEVSTVGLPQNLRRTLEEWGARHERITIRRGVGLLQAVDAETLDALYEDPQLGRLLGRRVADVAALVPVANLRTLYERLLDSEQMPALSEGDDRSPRPIFTLDAEGRITFRHPLPSIHVLRILRPLADGGDAVEPAAGEGLRLTSDSLRRAAATGLSAEEIIARLEPFHAGPLSEETLAAIKRWAKDWGRGALVEAVLLQAERPEVLADLLADPALKPYLQRVPGAPSLALVHRSGVERVRSALQERGMQLQSELLR